MSDTENVKQGTDDSDIKREKVRVVPLKYVDDFPGHPFKVIDDESMKKLVDSIREYGVLNPVIARKKPDEYNGLRIFDNIFQNDRESGIIKTTKKAGNRS